METIGIEVETTSLPQRSWEKCVPTWAVETDGSIRRYKQINSDFPFGKLYKFPEEGGRRNPRYGAELISPIIKVDERMWGQVSPIFRLLKDSGEVCRANMSIHVHVGFKLGVKVIAERMDFLEEVDKLLYDVSAPTGIPRGIFNEFMYYRPLTSPQYAESENSVYRPSIGNVRNVTNLDELTYTLGRKDLARNKWYPARYCGINLASILQHHTLEFRHFNFTSDFLTMKAWVYMCLGIYRSLATKKDKVDIESLVVLGAKDLETDKSLERIFNNLKVYPIYDRIDLSPVLTHTNQEIYWFYSYNIPPSKAEELYPGESVPRSAVTVVKDAHPFNVLEDSDKLFLTF